MSSVKTTLVAALGLLAAACSPGQTPQQTPGASSQAVPTPPDVSSPDNSAPSKAITISPAEALRNGSLSISEEAGFLNSNVVVQLDSNTLKVAATAEGPGQATIQLPASIQATRPLQLNLIGLTYTDNGQPTTTGSIELSTTTGETLRIWTNADATHVELVAGTDNAGAMEFEALVKKSDRLPQIGIAPSLGTGELKIYIGPNSGCIQMKTAEADAVWNIPVALEKVEQLQITAQGAGASLTVPPFQVGPPQQLVPSLSSPKGISCSG